jgi:hypothetical protein
LRTIRALRFIAVLNQKLRDSHKISPIYSKERGIGGEVKIQLFDIETKTRASLKDHTKLVEQVSNERIKDEMMKVFVS